MDGDGGPRRDDAPHRVVPGSTRPCGCHVRLPDYRDARCAEHAARRAERRAAERRRAEQRAHAAEVRAVLEDVDGQDLDVGGTVRLDHAVTDPAVARTSGYDSAGDAAAAGGASAALAAVTALLLGRWVVARRRSR